MVTVSSCASRACSVCAGAAVATEAASRVVAGKQVVVTDAGDDAGERFCCRAGVLVFLIDWSVGSAVFEIGSTAVYSSTAPSLRYQIRIHGIFF